MATRPRPAQGGAKAAALAPAPAVFVSYCHANHQALAEFLEFLGPMCRRMGLPLAWVDQAQLQGGTHWAQAIQDGMEAASVFVVLVSQKYCASSFCMGTELRHMLHQERLGRAKVIGVVLHDVNLADFTVADPDTGEPLSLADLQCLPQGLIPGKDRTGLVPLNKWPSAPDGWHQVQQQIERALEDSPTPGQAQAAPASLGLPFLCDRRKQVRLLSRRLADWREDGCRRPLVLLHDAGYVDCPAEWVQRLALFELLDALADEDDAALSPDFLFGLPRLLAWPDLADSLEDAEDLWREALAVGAGLKKRADWDAVYSAVNRPIKWWTRLPLDVSPEVALWGLEAFIQALVDWPDVPASPGAAQVFSLYLLVPDGASAEHALRQVFLQRLNQAQEEGALFVISLERLPGVMAADVDEWAEHERVKPRIRGDVQRLRSALGASGKPMYEFAEAFKQWMRGAV
jgi:TIR domain